MQQIHIYFLVKISVLMIFTVHCLLIGWYHYLRGWIKGAALGHTTLVTCSRYSKVLWYSIQECGLESNHTALSNSVLPCRGNEFKEWTTESSSEVIIIAWKVHPRDRIWCSIDLRRITRPLRHIPYCPQENANRSNVCILHRGSSFAV